MAISFKVQFHLLVVVFVLLESLTAVSLPFNQPKFCQNAAWNLNGSLFTNVSIGSLPHGVFVHVNNDMVYVTEQGANRVRVWSAAGGVPIRILSNGLNNPGSIFVTINGDIYVDSGNNYRVELWTSNATSGVAVMNTNVQCMGLFIDNNNTLYCSASDNHQVVAKSLNGNNDSTVVVAGNGSYGSASNQLCDPNGVFVDNDFNLYVADWCNSRIQKFYPGQTNGITVAGDSAPGTISLSGPTAVNLDGNSYLFIVDSWNNRVVGSGPRGFRCLIGCSGTTLNLPHSLGFNSDGSLIVADRSNDRILKFTLVTNSCDSTSSTMTKSSQLNLTTTISTKISTSTIRTTIRSTTVLMRSRNISTFSSSTRLSVRNTTISTSNLITDQSMNSTSTSVESFISRIYIWLYVITVCGYTPLKY